MAVYKLPVNLTFPIGSKRGVNTWHFRSTTVPAPGPLPIPDAIKAFYNAIKVIFPGSTTISFDGVLTEVGTPTPTVIGNVTPWSVTGGATNDDYPAAGVGLCVGWRSSLATRRGRGRTFLAPVSRVTFDSVGTILDTQLATIKTAATALCSTSLADGNGAVVVWSPTDNTGRDVIGSKVNDRVAWLSSRRG